MNHNTKPPPAWEFFVIYIFALSLFVLGAWAIASGQLLGALPFGLGLWAIIKL